MTDAVVGAGRSGAAGPAAAAPVVQLPPAVAAEHGVAVAALRESYAALAPDAPVRLAKRTSNLFRFREPAPKAPGRRAAPGPGSAAGLDASAFTRVLHVDPDAPGCPATQDDHPRRRGHRPRHRIDLAAQRPATRVGHRHGGPHGGRKC